MDFIEMWQQAIENDPYWQFEDILEEDPEIAEALWNDMRVWILVEKKLNEIEQPALQNRKE